MEITGTTTIAYGVRNGTWKISINGRRVGPPISHEDAVTICEWLRAVRKEQQQSEENAR